MTITENDFAPDANTQSHEQTNEHTNAQAATRDDDAPHVTVPADSGIVGGGTPGDSSDIATASGPSGSGGG